MIAAGLAIVSILGSIFGLEARFRWLSKIFEAETDKKDVKPRRKTGLFPKSAGTILPADRDAEAQSGPTPCATDSYFNVRPSSYDENTGVYVEWSFGGDITVLDKAIGSDTLEIDGWAPAECDYRGVEEFGSPFSSYEQSPYSAATSVPIPARRGPMRSSFSGHSHSVSGASFSRTPYMGGGNIKPAQTVGYSSPEMSPNYYADELSPHYDACSRPSVTYEPPASLSGLFSQPPPIDESFALEQHTKEWYQGELVNYEETSCNPSLLTVDDEFAEPRLNEPQFAKSFMLTPKLQVCDYRYTTNGVAYDEKTVSMSPDSSSPLSMSSHMTSPSTTSPPGMRSSEGLFACTECDATFRVKGYLTRHLKKHAENKAYTCPFFDPEKDRPCHPTGGFSRRDTYKAHLKSRHFTYPKKTRCSQRSQVAGHCRECGEQFESNEIWAERHVRPRLCKGIVEDL